MSRRIIIIVIVIINIIIRIIIVSAPRIPAGPRVLGFFIPRCPAPLFSSISYLELQAKAFEHNYDSALVVP